MPDLSALFSVIAYLLEELKEARGRAMSPSDEFQLLLLLQQSGRRTRRLRRFAAALAAQDALTPAEGTGSMPPEAPAPPV